MTGEGRRRRMRTGGKWRFVVLCVLCCASCTTQYARQIPPVGVWSYRSASIVHGLVIEIDMFSDETFTFRQASGDSKTMTRRYEMRASGTYTVEDRAILFNLSAPIGQPPTVPPIHDDKNPGRQVLKGTILETGKKLTVDYFGPYMVFTWRSPS